MAANLNVSKKFTLCSNRKWRFFRRGCRSNVYFNKKNNNNKTFGLWAVKNLQLNLNFYCLWENIASTNKSAKSFIAAKIETGSFDVSLQSETLLPCLTWYKVELQVLLKGWSISVFTVITQYNFIKVCCQHSLMTQESKIIKVHMV